MACKKHVQRKRPNTCADCAAELSKSAPKPKQEEVKPKKPNEKTIKAMKEADKIISEKTSRDMLAEISSMEKEVDEMVIKPERQKKEKVVNNTAPLKVEVPEETKSVIEINKEAIDKYFQDKLKEFKQAIAGLSHIQYEHFDIPLDKMNVALLDKLYNDKWHLVNFLTGASAKASGFSSDVAVFDRVKGNGNKSVSEWKKETK